MELAPTPSSVRRSLTTDPRLSPDGYIDNPQALFPYDYAQAKVAEDQVKVLGDTGDLQLGDPIRSISPSGRVHIC